jgi:hypothetical protein
MNKKLFDKNKSIYKLVKSNGWKLFKEQVDQDILDFQSVMNVDISKPEEVILDIKVRKNLVDYISKLIGKFEGQAKQFEENELKENDHELDDLRAISHIKI